MVAKNSTAVTTAATLIALNSKPAKAPRKSNAKSAGGAKPTRAKRPTKQRTTVLIAEVPAITGQATSDDPLGTGLPSIPEPMIQARPPPGISMPPRQIDTPEKKHTMRNWIIFFTIVTVLAVVVAFGTSSDDGGSGSGQPPGPDTPGGGGTPAPEVPISPAVSIIGWAFFALNVVMIISSLAFTNIDIRRIKKARRENEDAEKSNKVEEELQKELKEARKRGLTKQQVARLERERREEIYKNYKENATQPAVAKSKAENAKANANEDKDSSKGTPGGDNSTVEEQSAKENEKRTGLTAWFKGYGKQALSKATRMARAGNKRFLESLQEGNDPVKLMPEEMSSEQKEMSAGEEEMPAEQKEMSAGEEEMPAEQEEIDDDWDMAGRGEDFDFDVEV
jgi:hypothetical protein